MKHTMKKTAALILAIVLLIAAAPAAFADWGQYSREEYEIFEQTEDKEYTRFYICLPGIVGVSRRFDDFRNMMHVEKRFIAEDVIDEEDNSHLVLTFVHRVDEYSDDLAEYMASGEKIPDVMTVETCAWGEEYPTYAVVWGTAQVINIVSTLGPQGEPLERVELMFN